MVFVSLKESPRSAGYLRKRTRWFFMIKSGSYYG